LEAFDLRRAVFLDTETTGLAGGTGTAAFLVGVGWVEGERFRFRQYFMRDYHEEAALLRGLAEDLAGVERIVTFNGALFDVPLLEARYRLNRERFPFGQALHFDLLHPARRLWKARLESCRLQSLERALLGVTRRGDVPGEEIPRIYFDFVRRRDGRAMARVLEHNRLDVLSLAALAALACQWVEGGHAEDPRDVYCLARVLERASLHERSEEQYQRLLAEPPGFLRTASLLRLAARAKKAGKMETAVAYWQEAARSGDWLALRELALHHEHRSRDLPAALSAVEDGLGRLDGEDGPGTRRAIQDFHRRRHRLLGKLGRRRRPSPA
jgi:tetratricopeptide (TPR) repeat protein